MTDNFYETQREEVQYRTGWDIYPKILEKVKVSPGEWILDAGCGIGELSNHLDNTHLHGFDNNKLAIKIAKKKKKYAQIIKKDIIKLPYSQKIFDKTFCIEVLEYLDKPLSALKELLRVTDGEVIVSSANFNWYKLKSYFSKEWKEQYKRQIKRNNMITNKAYFESLARTLDCNVKIFYVSNRFNWFRSLFGNHLASEVVGVFTE